MPSHQTIGKRVIVIGTTGSGKSTMAKQLAIHLARPHIELDALHWEAGWVEAPVEVFRARVTDAISADQWVLDGNYTKVRDLTWSEADTLIWLDYPMRMILWRLVWRTLRRTLGREILWNGNRERFFEAFFSRHSLLLWALKTHKRRTAELPHLFKRPEFAHLKLLHFRSPRDAARWFDSIIVKSRF